MNRDQEKVETSLKSFQDITLSEDDKREVHSKMMEKLEKRTKRNWRWDFRPVLSLAVVGLLLLGGGYFLSQQLLNSEEAQQADEQEDITTISPYEELEKEVAEKMGGPIHIPYNVGIPLRSAIMYHYFKRMNNEEEIIGDTLVMNFVYSDSKLEREDTEQFEEMKKGWGDALVPIYGQYVAYEKQTVNFSVSNKENMHIDDINRALIGEERTIAGRTVSYRKYDTEVSNVRISFEVDHFIYSYNFRLDRINEAQAMQFVTKAIEQINSNR